MSYPLLSVVGAPALSIVGVPASGHQQHLSIVGVPASGHQQHHENLVDLSGSQKKV